MEKYQKIRPQGLPGLQKRFGMIELATLTAPEQRVREIERFRREARNTRIVRITSSTWQPPSGRQSEEEAIREFRSLLGLNANSQVWEKAGSLLLSSKEYALAREFSNVPPGKASRAWTWLSTFYTWRGRNRHCNIWKKFRRRTDRGRAAPKSQYPRGSRT